jgi:hypothetical protein
MARRVDSGDEVNRPEAWSEVNILPVSAGDPMALLTTVIDPLVHGVLREGMDLWHFFWEPELRFRARWRPMWADPAAKSGGTQRLLAYLTDCRRRGLLRSFTEAPYEGEAASGHTGGYGPEVWELVAADWMSGCELALALIRHHAAGDLTQSMYFHWARRAHLFTNQIIGPEISWMAHLARQYMRDRWEGRMPDWEGTAADFADGKYHAVEVAAVPNHLRRLLDGAT